MGRYAEGTSVSSEKSRAEIERTLTRYGADQFLYGWKDDHALVAFRMNGRHIKFLLPMPNRDDDEFVYTPSETKMRDADGQQAAFEKAIRQRWRALALVIKAKLESVEAGITVFDEEFMAHIVMPDGLTVSEHMLPQIDSAYETGNMPPLLPDYSGGTA